MLELRAPASRVSGIIGERWGDVLRVIPRLSASRLITDGGPFEGARRARTLARPIMRLDDNEEELIEWDEERSFTYVFGAPPWPMARIRNTWRLDADGAGTRVTLTPALTMRGGRFT